MIESYAPTNGYKTFYKIFNEKSKLTPIVALHGGPGSTHHYMLGLSKLAEIGHKVILFDQAGSGNTKHNLSKEEMVFETFIDQLDSLTDYLNLSKYNLIGHSWGGILAIEYLVRAAEENKKHSINKVVISSGMYSIPFYEKCIAKLIEDLSEENKEIILRNIKNGTPDSDEFLKAHEEYDNKHIFRGKVWPELYRSPKGFFYSELYHYMWGSSESYVADGSLYTWDRTNDLHKISIPTLVTCGEFDELTPEQAQICADLIPNAELKVFEGASHCHHVESEDEYMKTLSEFFNKN